MGYLGDQRGWLRRTAGLVVEVEGLAVARVAVVMVSVKQKLTKVMKKTRCHLRQRGTMVRGGGGGVGGGEARSSKVVASFARFA